MQRSYEYYIKNHLREYQQMIFLSGPRQVGKTTLCKSIDDTAFYFNWDYFYIYFSLFPIH